MCCSADSSVEASVIVLIVSLMFSISGGKDSCYNMMQCVQHGHVIVALANLKPKDGGMFAAWPPRGFPDLGSPPPPLRGVICEFLGGGVPPGL